MYTLLSWRYTSNWGHSVPIFEAWYDSKVRLMYFYIYNVEWNAAYVSNVEEHLLHHGQSVLKAVLDYNGGHKKVTITTSKLKIFAPWLTWIKPQIGIHVHYFVLNMHCITEGEGHRAGMKTHSNQGTRIDINNKIPTPLV